MAFNRFFRSGVFKVGSGRVCDCMSERSGMERMTSVVEIQITVNILVYSCDLKFQVWVSRSLLLLIWLTCLFYYCHQQEEMNCR